ncbi:MAG: endonuclease III [Chloracidobacterium sp.]|nr:endonuclease III [Chloracidobacterium sp.]
MIGDTATRSAEIIRRLKKTYPDAHCALQHSNAFELLIATILSAQCTDERVNIVTSTLFRKYRSPQDFLAASQTELENDIRSTGFFRNKAKNIRAACERIVEVYGGKVPDSMEDILTLGGVARKTANVVLGNAFGIASGVVVDTHVSRLSQRLGLTEAKQPEKIEADLMELVPKKHWIMFPHWMIFHGRQVCQARKPKCASCVLADLCPYFASLEVDTKTISPAARPTPPQALTFLCVEPTLGLAHAPAPPRCAAPPPPFDRLAQSTRPRPAAAAPPLFFCQ